MKSPSPKQWISGFTLAVAIGGYGAYQHRENRIERLYAEAAGIAPYVRSSTEAQAAVGELAKYHGQRMTEMLLNVALGRTRSLWQEVQCEAIEALAGRSESGPAETLAALLQPQQPFPIRMATANALRKLPCGAGCIRTILHYLERVAWGEPNYEDRSISPPGEFGNGVMADIRKEQASLYEALYDVLRRNSRVTVLALDEVYGLGTDAPSTFALSLLTRTRLQDGCPALLESAQLLKQSSPELFAAPREQLDATIKQLGCR